MSEIDGAASNNISAQQKAQYHQEYQETLSCFNKSFSDYTQKKGNSDQLRKVMEDSLGLLNKTAQVALSKQKQAANEKLHADYDNYMSDPSSSNESAVKQDISELS